MPYWSLRAGGTTSRPVASLMPPREVEPGRDEFQGILLEIQLGVGFLLGDFFMGWETGVFMGLEWDLNGILIGIRYVMCDLFKTSGGWLARALTNQFFKGGFLLFLNRTQVWVRFFEIQLEAATWWVEFHHDLLPTINLGYGMISHDITMQPATNGDMHVYYELLHHHDKHNVWLIKKW